jgi:hypothetical protein
MYFMRLIFFLLLGLVFVYSKTVGEDVEIKDDKRNAIESMKEEKLNNANENSNENELYSNEKPTSFVNKELNSAESWKESLLSFMSSNRTAKGVCGGGCILSSQCADYAGDKNCRCSWFSCERYSVVKK